MEVHENGFNNDLPIPYFCFSRCSAIDMCLNSDPVIWKGTPVDCSEIGTSLHCHSMLQLVATATTQNPRFHCGVRLHDRMSSTHGGWRSNVSPRLMSAKGNYVVEGRWKRTGDNRTSEGKIPYNGSGRVTFQFKSVFL